VKRILDIGTGNSPFPHLLAKKGASIVGYDKSPKQIQLARACGQSPCIEYVVATPQAFLDRRQFDSANSITVLPYAENIAELGFVSSLRSNTLFREESLCQSPLILDFQNSKQIFLFDA
jgi:2-polyprenyl-3-methyl-5-hydroxy-6-metoxy-1,4-benzoquinol methylase